MTSRSLPQEHNNASFGTSGKRPCNVSKPYCTISGQVDMSSNNVQPIRSESNNVPATRVHITTAVPAGDHSYDKQQHL